MTQPPTFDPSSLPAADRESFAALSDEAQRDRLADLIEAGDMPAMIAYARINPARLQEIIARLGDPQAGTRFDDTLFDFFALANNTAVEAVVAALDVESAAAVLEIGFGGGYGIQLAADRGLQVTGVEYSAASLEGAARSYAREAVESGRATLQQGDAADLPFDDSTFDATYHVNCYYFWPDLVQGVAECLRVLKPGGVMVTGSKLAAATLILGPNGEYDVDNVFRNTDETAYLAALESAGFADITAEPRQGVEGQPITDFTIIRSRRP
jgi:SAM-dependent methyltransferase